MSIWKQACGYVPLFLRSSRKKEREQREQEQQASKPDRSEQQGSNEDNQTRVSQEEDESSKSLETSAMAAEEGVSGTGNATDDSGDDKLALRIHYLEQDARQYPIEKMGALVGSLT